jgi:hypothetical protein
MIGFVINKIIQWLEYRKDVSLMRPIKVTKNFVNSAENSVCMNQE